MLDGLTILVVEDEPTAALDLSLTVLRVGGNVIGPATTTGEALCLIAKTFAAGVPLSGAILGVELTDRDVTPVALILHACSVPMVIFSDMRLPPAVAALIPPVPAISTPDTIDYVVAKLHETIADYDLPTR